MSDPQRDAIQNYYNQGREAQRLTRDARGKLELARTQEIILRNLPPPPATVLDVGGGAGVYALWLAARGYRVHLIDPLPLHIEQARGAAGADRLASATVGDARCLTFPDESADLVLMLGPLYHLTERDDRLRALREAHRVVKRGGWVFAAAITRYASLLDGLVRGLLNEPDFALIVRQDLTDGQHRNPNGHPRYFTTAFLHHPDELRAELHDAAFEAVQVLAVEGVGWLGASLEQFWEDDRLRDLLLDLLRRTEAEPTLLGTSSHLLAVGRRPV